MNNVEKLNIREVLDSLYNKDFEFNKIKYGDTHGRFRSIDMDTVETQFKYRKSLLFWILFRYFNYENIGDCTISITEIQTYFEDQLTYIWQDLSSEVPDEIIEASYKCSSEIKWSSYKCQANDDILFDYIIDYFIDYIPERYLLTNLFSDKQWNNDVVCASIIQNLSYWGTSLEDKNVLLKGFSSRFIVFFLHHTKRCQNLTILNNQPVYNLYLELIAYYFKVYNLNIIEDIDHLDSKSGLDFIISTDSKDSISNIVPMLSSGGYCILGNQNCDNKILDAIFSQYKLSFISDFSHGNSVENGYLFLIQNCQNSNEEIKYLKRNDLYSEFNETKLELNIEECVNLLSDKLIDYSKCQTVCKEDFLYSSENCSAKFVFRDKEEVSFNWFAVSDIFQEIADNNLHCTTLLDQKDVVLKLDNVGFNFDLPYNYYLGENNYIGVEPFDIHSYSDKLSIRKDDKGELSLYGDIDIVTRIFGPEPILPTEDDKKYLQVSTQRVLNVPAYLASRGNFFKVDASDSHFVSYTRYDASMNEYDQVEYIDNVWVPYQINNAFYDYCVMYLMHKHHKEITDDGHILLPKTKEEQKKYFYKKQYEYYCEHPEEMHSLNLTDTKLHFPKKIDYSIGFSNFRRFKQLPKENLKDITILVGGNNSGKSTFVKGLILLLDNLKHLSLTSKNLLVSRVPIFRFDAHGFYDVNISIFSRAIYNQAIDNTICFNLSIGYYDIALHVEGDKNKNQTAVPISLIDIKDNKRDLHFCFDFKNQKMSLVTPIGDFTKQGINMSVNETDESLISAYISFFTESVIVSNDSTGCLAANFLKINESAYWLRVFIRSINIEYIHAHAAVQNILYNTADKNDYMAQTIHEFVSQNISTESQEYCFVRSWMRKLGIGDDFLIENIAGEAYTFKVCNENSNKEYLADKGIGSNQLMILLLKIATIVNKYGDNRIRPIIFIEEPEQNIHPALQSLLADLLYSANQQFGLKFIVETHSEYFVRKTQVIVSKSYNTPETLINNPFVVYYFPESDLPYDMKYSTSGRFEEKFGEGFYDAAGSLHLQLPRLERRR